MYHACIYQVAEGGACTATPRGDWERDYADLCMYVHRYTYVRTYVLSMVCGFLCACTDLALTLPCASMRETATRIFAHAVDLSVIEKRVIKGRLTQVPRNYTWPVIPFL